MQDVKRKIVIVGNGIAGVSCAIEIRRKDKQSEILIISKESQYHYSRPALMYMYMGHMKFEHTKPYENHFWKEENIDLLMDNVVEIDSENKILKMQESPSINYDELVLAVGSKYNKFGWPGQDLKGAQGLYNLQDLEELEINSQEAKSAVIVGGGMIGIEMAEMLATRNIKVIFLVREKSFWSSVLPPTESKMVNEHILSHHIDLRLGEQLEEILDDGTGKVKGITTPSGEIIDCQIVGLTAGVSPNIQWINESANLKTNRGVIVDFQFKTNIPNIYAIGDCAEFTNPYPGQRPVEQVWYTGKMHGTALGKILCGESDFAYKPGIWWNSAKFFDLEYQTYGIVPAKLSEEQGSFIWKHETENQCLNITYNKNTGIIEGFNFMGIRGRHVIAEKWITEQKTLDFVIQNLGAMNFDPEFFTPFEIKVVEEYNRQFPNRMVELKTKKGLFSKIFNNLKTKTTHLTEAK